MSERKGKINKIVLCSYVTDMKMYSITGKMDRQSSNKNTMDNPLGYMPNNNLSRKPKGTNDREGHG